MTSIWVPSTLAAQELASINRRNRRIMLQTETERFINRHKRFQARKHCKIRAVKVKNVDEFPSFLPGEVKNIKDSAAREMARRIQRLPVQTSVSEQPIMSSCVMPKRQTMEATPVVLLHGFDSSCLEWRYTYPLLEAVGMEPWAVDLLGWGFNSREGVLSFSVAAKREHLYMFWKHYIKRPMVLVGPSLGAAATVDFAVFYPEAVTRLVLIDASVYAEGTGNMAKFPKILAYAGVSLLKSIPLRSYANLLTFHSISIARILDSMNVGRLHCLLPHWEDASVDFMLSGGYTVANRIREIEKKTLLIWGENDKIVSKEYAKRLQNDLPDSQLQYISKCGHIPHVEKPDVVAKMIIDFLKE